MIIVDGLRGVLEMAIRDVFRTLGLQLNTVLELYRATIIALLRANRVRIWVDGMDVVIEYYKKSYKKEK